MSGPGRTQRLLGWLRVLVRELDELTRQRPTLAELCSVGVECGSRDEPRGELHLASGATATEVLAWCHAVHATSGRCLPSVPDEPGRTTVTVTATGRLGELPVRLLTNLPRELADQLGAEWGVRRLDELLSASPRIEPTTGGGR